MELHQLLRRFRLALGLFALVLVLGAVGFWVLGRFFQAPGMREATDDFSLLNCFYMSAITVTTVGYGEVTNFHDHLTPQGASIAKGYTAVFCIVSYIVVLYATAIIVAALVEGAVGKAFQMRRLRKMLSKLEGHYIVCGAGTTGHHIVEELRTVQEHVVAIDRSPEALAVWEEVDQVLCLEGDATRDDVMHQAGVARARGVFAVLNDDKDNLFICLAARQANPTARIVGRAIDTSNVAKLKAAGADRVVAPNMIGGLRMASEMVRPNVVTFLDTMLRATDASLRFSEVLVQEGDDAAGRSLEALRTPQELDVNIVALFHEDKSIIYNPQSTVVLQPGDTLIAICSSDQRAALEAHIRSGRARYANDA